MKKLLSLISIGLLWVGAGSCHCQKNASGNETNNKDNQTTQTTTNIKPGSTLNRQAEKNEVTEIKHKGPHQSKIDSAKAAKNKMKMKTKIN